METLAFSSALVIVDIASNDIDTPPPVNQTSAKIKSMKTQGIHFTLN
jgi:hypothetical protein